MMKPIRTVISGAGYRGRYLLQLLQQIPPFAAEGVYDPFAADTPGNIKAYKGGHEGFLQMLADIHPDLVVIASPWKCHLPQAMSALEAGCHVALEIKGGLGLDEYRPAIESASRKRLKIFPLENTVFLRENMAVCNLVNQGVLGDIIALRGGYRHDLRHILAGDGESEHPACSESVWRSAFYFEKNADLYPTHGFAPLCVAAGINRTDFVTELTSFASRAQGLAAYIRGKGGETPASVKTGDIIITQMRTQKSRLITLTHDTTLPRPRSLDFEIQGTKGIWQGFAHKIYVEGSSPAEEWEDDAPYISRYEHPLWKKWGEEALHSDRHHQGMDYMMLRTLAADLLQEEAFPTTGEDLALWTSVTPLSEISIREKRTVFLHPERTLP